MANEDKKDFNAMLHDSKDMPKMKIITDTESIDVYKRQVHLRICRGPASLVP